MNRLLLFTSAAVLYLAHQDFWFWREARPLLFGFLPVGLAYHGLYCLAVAGLMWWLTRVAWPSDLEAAAGRRAPPGRLENPSSPTPDGRR